MRRALVLLPLVAAACFGSGPDPGPVAGAVTVRPLVTVPANGGMFVHQVVMGGSRMIVVLEGTLGPGPQIPGTIENVPLDGSPSSKLADIPNSSGFAALDGNTVLYASTDSGQPTVVNAVGTGASGTAAKQGETTTTGANAAGMATDSTAIYVATTVPGPQLLNAPSSTGGGDNGGGGGGNNGALFRIDRTTKVGTQIYPPANVSGGQSPSLLCGPLKRCLWSDGSALYFLTMSPDGGGTRIARITPPAVTAGTFATIESTATVTGVAFDAGSVYWSQFDQSNNCAVMRVPKIGGGKITVATLQGTSCRDLAIDHDHVYVATIGPIYANNPSGPTQGTGIARAPLAGGAFAIAPLSRSDWFGATTLEVDDTNVYAVSPNVVLAVPKTILP
jgi:hypothetical protein